MSNLRTLILVAAVCSGCATLVYELLWIRALVLTIGATFPAITVVLAGFMTGLGLGSVLGGRIADRTARPLRAYAVVELLVAVVAVAYPYVALAVTRLDLPAIGPLSGRAILAGLTMLPATTLIGTTFPLLSAGLHTGDGGGHVPRLYAANTLGAALGAFLGGLFLPYWFGVAGALAAAAGLNLLAAFLATRVKVERLVAPEATPAAEGGAPPPVLLWLAFGSGVLMTFAQLFWTRATIQMENAPLSDPSSTMAVILATLLLGNAVGSTLAGRLETGRLDAVARPLAWTWIVGAIATVSALEWFAVRFYGLPLENGHPWLAFSVRLAPILLASVVLGFGFPLLTRFYAGALAGHGQRLGRIWAFNTAGAVLGSIFGGWLLMPTLGTDRGLLFCGVLGLALALTVALYARRRADAIGAALGGLAILVVGLAVPLGAGQEFLRRYGPNGVIARWEGWEATTVVAQDPKGQRLLFSNGRGMTGRQSYVLGGRALAAANPNAKTALLVGFGTGLFAQGVLQNLPVERLVIVEMDGAQLGAAEWFGTESVLTDERVEIVIDDGLHYLDRTHEVFDLIAVDVWGPETSPSIYGTEFYERALDHLTESGRFWAKLTPLDDTSLGYITDALRCTFPVAYLSNRDALVGARRPIYWSGQGLTGLAPADADCRPLSQMRPRRLVAGMLDMDAPPAARGAGTGGVPMEGQPGMQGGYPQQGMQGGYQQGYPQQGMQGGYQQGYPQQGMQGGYQQGYPQQGMQGGYPQGGYQQGYPQGAGDQGYPPR